MGGTDEENRVGQNGHAVENPETSLHHRPIV